MSVTFDLARLLRIYWSLLLGNVVEWYEYAIFGYLEPYLEDHFFRGSAVATWLGFAVTFMARPLGGTVLGTIGDMFGRSVAVNLSIVGMLVGTCGQGLLPTYSSGSDTLGLIGIILLIVMRFLQGISAAGEISTISIYITEVGSHESLGRSISLIAITVNIGFLFAKAVVFALRSGLGEEAMRSWGWRAPFVLALLPGLVAVWGRRWLPESDAFLEQRKAAQAGGAAADDEEEPGDSAAAAQPSIAAANDEEEPGDLPMAARPSVAQVMWSHGHNMLIGMGGVASFSILQYGGFVWMQSYLLKKGLSASGRMLAGLCSRGLMIALALPVGWLTDVKGVGWVTFVGACFLAIGGLPLFALLATYPTDLTVVMLTLGVGFALLGSIGGTVYFYFVAELFPTAVRGAAVGISYNVGFSFFGGLAPVIAQASLAVSPFGPGFLFSVGGLITVCSVGVGLCLERRGLVQLAHVRRKPYFASCEARGEDEDSSSASSSELESSGENGE